MVPTLPLIFIETLYFMKFRIMVTTAFVHESRSKWFLNFKCSFIFAVCAGHINIVRILIKHGADVNAKGDSLSTPLHSACQNPTRNDNLLQITKILIAFGANVNAQNAEQSTPLHECAFFGSYRKNFIWMILSCWLRWQFFPTSMGLIAISMAKSFKKIVGWFFR